ncbi:MAG: sporulation transcription factor Spo0A [Clostridiales bacterium]|nr:sporulation transcription factor Spo0A [Clostridiales bacterium]
MESLNEGKQLKIYFADKTEESFIEYFKENEGFDVVGNSWDGNQVVEQVLSLKPDVLVMEVMLGGLDGFGVLEKIRVLKDKMPKVFFVSNLSHSGFVTKAIQSGASYFMVKPVSAENLENRIFEIVNNNRSQADNRQLEEKISNIFISIGIPAHIKGYQFLREAVKLAVEEPEIIGSITKKLYPTIAERFETSSSKVERGMRHAIEVAWNRGKIENINNIFGLKIYNRNEKPTNGELIALIADKMIMDG